IPTCLISFCCDCQGGAAIILQGGLALARTGFNPFHLPPHKKLLKSGPHWPLGLELVHRHGN
ncbi:MAG TPA: hypothetical protein VGJ22_09860, partial [Anaerolineales bacterium]